MLYLIVLIMFAVFGMVASGLAYSRSHWRYAMAVTTLCATFLAAWTAAFLQSWMRHLSAEIGPVTALAIAALPFGTVLFRLVLRRRNTPHPAPRADDDPVFRRYREEKLRRRRLRRQEDELLENSDGPIGPEANGL